MPDSRQAFKFNGIAPLGLVSALVIKTANYTLGANDSVVLGNASGGAFTLTLPAAAGLAAGRVYTLKKTDSSANAIAIATTSGQTIDGAASLALSLSRQWQYVQVVSDGSNWQVIDGTALLSTTAGDFQPSGAVGSAGATGRYADAGHRHPLNSNSINAPSAQITTTDTVLITLAINPANVVAGSMFRAVLHTLWTNTATQTVNTFTLRAGTTGTTADGTVGAFAPTNATSTQTAAGLMLDATFTVQAVGVSGSLIGVMMSFATAAGFVGQGTGIQQLGSLASWNTNTATFLSLSFRAGGTSSKMTVNQAAFAQVA